MLRALCFVLAGCSGSGNSPPTIIEDLAAPPDLARSVDLGGADPSPPPVADPWISSGGGSGNGTRRQLNLTVGAHGGAGRAVSAGGAAVTFGAFSTQTY